MDIILGSKNMENVHSDIRGPLFYEALEMEKRGSKYLRYALYNATKYVCCWEPTFSAYLAKKRSEGKHYNEILLDNCYLTL